MRAPILCCLWMASLCTSVHAQQQTSGWEFGAELIYQASTDVTFDGGSTAEFEDELGIDLLFGYRFNQHLSLHFSLDWQRIDYRLTVRSVDLPGVEFSGDTDLEMFTPRISLNYNFMEGAVTPFVNAGLGWAFIDTNIPNSRVQVGCWWDPWWGQVCAPYQSTKSVDDFTYQVGAGVRWDIAEYYSLRFAYEKHWLDYSKATSTPDFDQWKVGFAWRY